LRMPLLIDEQHVTRTSWHPCGPSLLDRAWTPTEGSANAPLGHLPAIASAGRAGPSVVEKRSRVGPQARLLAISPPGKGGVEIAEKRPPEFFYPDSFVSTSKVGPRNYRRTACLKCFRIDPRHTGNHPGVSRHTRPTSVLPRRWWKSSCFRKNDTYIVVPNMHNTMHVTPRPRSGDLSGRNIHPSSRFP